MSNMSSRIQEQLERIKRWYRRFLEINDGREHTQDSNYYEDEVYAFFQNCYHLKDWIKNDPDVDQKIKGRIECYVQLNDALSLCADVCNASKHLYLTTRRSPQIGNNLRVQRNFALTAGGDQPQIIIKYNIVLEDGKQKDAFELASECISAWEQFIKDNQI